MTFFSSVYTWCVCVCVCANLPPSLPRYMKYLYPYESARRGLSSPAELQATIESNCREGHRPGYSSNLFCFSPSPSSTPRLLPSLKMHLATLNGLQFLPLPLLKSDLGKVGAEGGGNY